MGRWDWLWRIVAGAAVLCVAGVLAYPAVLYTDRSYYCENTGSRHGFRVWPNGAVTGRWSKTSPLEQFVAAESPGRLKHEWRSISHVGKNFLGRSVMRGCGPVGGTLFLKPEIAQAWIDRSEKATVLALYDALLASDMQADTVLVQGVEDAVAAAP
jgi:hypothetical protein